jgi:pyruvate/2-oxoglutarate dehydrogenase complex dihydrolipoamide acyltransferase (E2) component
MKTILKIAVLAPASVLMFLADAPPEIPAPYVQLVPEAQAILGVRRRAFRRGVVVGDAVATSEARDMEAQQQQQQQQQAAAAPAPAPPPVAAPTPAPAPATDGKPLPLGTVVPAPPSGCTATPVGGVQYYYCGGNFYRAVFQGTTLVYVTAQPK